MKICKEKGETLSEDAKAKCAKLTKKVENAKQNANAVPFFKADKVIFISDVWYRF